MTTLVRKAGSATEPGEITLDPQVIAGAKTFNASMTLGIASNTPYDSYHTTNKNIFSAPTAGTSSSGAFAIGANAYYGSGRQPTRQVGTGGYLIALDNSTADGNFSFFVRANLAADSATTGAVNILQASQTGRFTFGRNDTANLSTVYTHAFESQGRTLLAIRSTGNAAGTGGAAIFNLQATGESGAQFSWYRGADGGSYNANNIIKWNWIHGGNGAQMTGGGVDSIAFYSYGIGNYMGQLCYDGRWIMGPEAGLGTGTAPYHTIYGAIRGQAGSSFRATFGGSIETYVSSNAYRDGSGNFKAMIGSQGVAYFGVYATTTGTSTAFDFQTTLTSTVDTTFSGNQIGRITAAGRWFIGDPALGTTQHAVYGSMESVVSPSLGYSLLARTFSALSVAGDSLDAVQIYNLTTFYGALGVAKTTNTTNQAGYIVLKSNNGTLYYMWFDDTGRLRVSTTQSHTGGQATGTVVGTQT